MNAKPVEAIAALRHYMADRVWPDMPAASLGRVLAWADSIPDGAVPVVWPDWATREEINRRAEEGPMPLKAYTALTALAAITPVRKKRMVNLWEPIDTDLYCRPTAFDVNWIPNPSHGWKLVARNVELEG